MTPMEAIQAATIVAADLMGSALEVLRWHDHASGAHHGFGDERRDTLRPHLANLRLELCNAGIAELFDTYARRALGRIRRAQEVDEPCFQIEGTGRYIFARTRRNEQWNSARRNHPEA